MSIPGTTTHSFVMAPLLLIWRVMDRNKILIIDEAGFSRVCSAILEFEGYTAETVGDTHETLQLLNDLDLSLIITSYPYGVFLLDKIKSRNIPLILLSDHISEDIIHCLEGFEKSFCMIKPLDYKKFRTVVKQLMSGHINNQGGISIV